MRKTSALLMSVILAASTSLSVFAAPSPTARTATNTVVNAQAAPQVKKEAAKKILQNSELIARVEQEVPTTSTQTTDPVTGQTVESKTINKDVAATAEAVGKTDGTTFYSIDSNGDVFEVAQENVAYNMISGNLSAADQKVAESDPNYLGTVSFVTTDLSGNVIASTVDEGSRGFAPRFNTVNAWKFLGPSLSKRNITYAQFAANPSIYKIKAVSGNRLVDTDLIRWVQGDDGRPVMVVNYRAFSSDGYAVVIDDTATYGSTADAVEATITGTATNPTLDPEL